MDAAIEAGLPEGTVVLRRWRHAGVDCVVADVHGELSGMARLGGRGRAGHGSWLLLRPVPARRYWSMEVLARFVSPGSAELAAWGADGAEWAIERVRRDVEEFVDSAPAPGHSDEPRTPSPV